MSKITWCVAYTQPLKETVAKRNLLEQGFEVYLPRFKKLARHARKVEEKLVPLFPRYIFVRMDLEIARWRSVNGTGGVVCLLTSDEFTPARVPDFAIERLRAQEEAPEIVPLTSLFSFTEGDRLKITDGAFKDQSAIFESFDDKARVRLLLSFMGRELKLSLPIHAVEKE